jgi:hypothetical protein
MTPADYINEIVIPTVREFRDERRSRRRAYLACIATFHLRDYLKKAGEYGVIDAMRTSCGAAFDVVRGISNGSKHAETDGSHAVAFRAGEDTERPPATWGKAVWDASRWDDIVGGREVRHEGDRHDLYECVKAVALAFQRNYSGQLGKCDLSDC